MEPLAVSPKQAATAIGCGITKLYEHINGGVLEAYKEGRSTRITVASIKAHVANRAAEFRAQRAA